MVIKYKESIHMVKDTLLLREGFSGLSSSIIKNSRFTGRVLHQSQVILFFATRLLI